MTEGSDRTIRLAFFGLATIATCSLMVIAACAIRYVFQVLDGAP